MQRHYSSFRALAAELTSSANQTFVHRWEDPSLAAQLPPHLRPENWDRPGRSGVSDAPKYLYRGEAGVYPTSMPSRARITAMFDEDELKLLDELTNLASWCWRLRYGDPARSIGWPQHYGFPTDVLDVTTDPSVALHFAADANGSAHAPVRVVYRIDVEAIESEIYGPRGAPTPLSGGSIEHEFCNRALRQKAWVLRSNDAEHPFDFQRSKFIANHIERFTVDAIDAVDFVRPDLLDPSLDFFACWPLAVLRSFKAKIERPLPKRLAEWIVPRIPLFEQTPVRIFYNQRGRGSSWQLMSPAEASVLDGRPYEADSRKIIEELISPELPTPSALLYGVPTGGEPGTDRLLRAGDECEIQWKYPFPGPPRFNSRAFERVVIR